MAGRGPGTVRAVRDARGVSVDRRHASRVVLAPPPQSQRDAATRLPVVAAARDRVVDRAALRDRFVPVRDRRGARLCERGRRARRRDDVLRRVDLLHERGLPPVLPGDQRADRCGGRRSRRRRRWIAWQPARIDWWACGVQSIGTLFFNVSTFAATRSALDAAQAHQHVWRPDMLGSIAFMVASSLAWFEVCHGWWAVRPRSVSWWIVAMNLGGLDRLPDLGVRRLRQPRDRRDREHPRGQPRHVHRGGWVLRRRVAAGPGDAGRPASFVSSWSRGVRNRGMIRTSPSHAARRSRSRATRCVVARSTRSSSLVAIVAVRPSAPSRRSPGRPPRSSVPRCRCDRTARRRASPRYQSRSFQPMVVGSRPGRNATQRFGRAQRRGVVGQDVAGGAAVERDLGDLERRERGVGLARRPARPPADVGWRAGPNARSQRRRSSAAASPWSQRWPAAPRATRRSAPTGTGSRSRSRAGGRARSRPSVASRNRTRVETPTSRAPTSCPRRSESFFAELRAPTR